MNRKEICFNSHLGVALRLKWLAPGFYGSLPDKKIGRAQTNRSIPNAKNRFQINQRTGIIISESVKKATKNLIFAILLQLFGY
ncbi:hypothetical protein GFO_0315 [Christiangramia forsetii KT0803]|uniref:Uncharacterized protein n=1 Tax=Christiangramia forsetii (strain DSM 17595 / CGMCC 1.15422 / KT0803) TaxID=411154 RepID=A0LY56_CHRFK|nr:hypothetical protein GFO_0315 [Christiangramia forsetii KT0803]